MSTLATHQQDQSQDNPALSRIIERNIRTMIQLRGKADDERSLQNRLADAVTAFAGSMTFVHLHTVWFAAWILLNTGRVGVRPFDPFPYGLLTMVVSLEAIFLSALVLITDTRTADAWCHSRRIRDREPPSSVGQAPSPAADPSVGLHHSMTRSSIASTSKQKRKGNQ